MSPGHDRTALGVARSYLALQALGGLVWWIAVASSSDVVRWTLGGWDPALLAVPDLVLFVGGSALTAWSMSRIAAVVTATWTVAVTAALWFQGLTTQQAGWGCVLMAVAAIGTVGATATIWFGRLPTDWFFVGPFRFRVAEESTGSRHLRRSLTQLVVFWTTFFILVPIVLSAIEHRLGVDWPFLGEPWAGVVGVVVFVLASALGLWSCVSMALLGRGTPLPAETARDLVVAGPYRIVRNPMAVAGMLQTFGIGLWFGSWMVLAAAVAGAVVWDLLIRPEEEADLRARFGEQYEEYTRTVRCWVPSRPTR